ncbi:MAG: Glutamate--tRNA ligase [Alphaproteobacteria bacterium MarineAlpha5_Bin8]|nr:MAG: Glutamate--tRNA ligase [Alphaproteobacteria bacterium MarineAlpha5_Bin7]PPR46572.1 MAG: Glutamate--tRNA ligase [Alphaproteobacteria bacterium MarineAlpha5_Bin8]PPR53280.1 MAG: Glutamate--tRNA ligase [Alphaproteobacteria bacterium MarineAlpha5_Bin6]|tara:strand:+ start:8283 stop:9692 length:1410 start_codon:yes stop_codon:yes gene_type:complete
MKNVIARFAPSPTGFLHIGGIRTALINYIIVQQSKSQKKDSKFYLRIEDTDKMRSKKEFEESIINGLTWLGIKWDDRIIHQSERINRHYEVANQLLKNNNAYKCICTPETLEKKRLENKRKHINVKKLCIKCEKNEKVQSLKTNYCVRIKIPSEGKLLLKDKIQGNISLENKELDNFILLRNDGTPTYMLSVVVDDYDMNVNTIIRGNDHLNNTFRQVYIYKHMEWQIPEYSHLPLIHGEDGSKLSKRHGAIDVNELNNLGYIPKSIINNLILLGWSPKKINEIIEIDEIIELFDINKISRSASIFDYNKLNYLNNYYLKENKNYKFFENYILNNNNLSKFIKEDHIKIKRVFDSFKNNINYFSQIDAIIISYFDHSFRTKSHELLNENFNIILKDFINDLTKIDDWNEKQLTDFIDNFLKKKKIKFPIFGKPLRIVLTNSIKGPSIIAILYALGKETSFLRLNNYIRK